LIFSFLFLTIPSVLMAQNGQKIYEAYVSNKMNQWKQTIDEMQKKSHPSNTYLLELINFQYGYIGYCIGEKKEKEAKTYIELAKQNLKILEQQGYSLSMVQAYYAAIYGFQIGLNVVKAPFLGPKSSQNAKEALKRDPENWFAHVQMGNIEFYMPSYFGGSKSKAIEYYQKAKALLEKEQPLLEKNWNYLSLLVILAQAYEEVQDYDNAEKYYKKIVSIEPNFLWVKNELYPNFIKKTKK
jgi:tetratricopeptide (TPR) repeat protein